MKHSSKKYGVGLEPLIPNLCRQLQLDLARIQAFLHNSFLWSRVPLANVRDVSLQPPSVVLTLLRLVSLLLFIHHSPPKGTLADPEFITPAQSLIVFTKHQINTL